MLGRQLPVTVAITFAACCFGCGGSQAPAETPPAATQSTANADALEPPEESGDPAEEPTAAAAATESSEGDAAPVASETPGGSALSDGETRTMKVIQQIVLDNRARFRSCYDDAQAKKPELQGDLTLYFVLDSEGKVREAGLNEARSTLKDPDLVKCIVEQIRQVPFPPSSKGLETKVNYPFNFNPK